MKYQAKPIIFEAVQWTGKNQEEIKNLCGDKVKFIMYDKVSGPPCLVLKTAPGIYVDIRINDYIREVLPGEFSLATPDSFDQLYTPINDIPYSVFDILHIHKIETDLAN